MVVGVVMVRYRDFSHLFSSGIIPSSEHLNLMQKTFAGHRVQTHDHQISVMKVDVNRLFSTSHLLYGSH